MRNKTLQNKNKKQKSKPHPSCPPLTSRGAVARRALLAVQVLEQLHALARHDDLLEDGLEEGDHGGLPAPGPGGGLLPGGAAAARVRHPVLPLHGLRDAVERVGGVPEVPVVHRHVFVPGGRGLGPGLGYLSEI